MSNSFVRSVRTSDRAAVAALCLNALTPEDSADRLGLERLLWETADITGLVAEEDGQVSGAAFGTVTADRHGLLSGAITLLAVEPGRRGHGTGSEMLRYLEGQLRAIGAREIWTGGGQPRFWWPGVDAQWNDVIRFFEGHGYGRDDEAFNMTVDLRTANLTARTTELNIRRLTADEWPAFYRWMTHMWEDPWADEVKTTLDRSPASCFVAVRESEYLGFAAYDTNRRGMFGPMGSGNDSRHAGVGGELLRYCLRDYVKQGLDTCEIGWVGPLEFYSKAVGATVSRRFVRLRKAWQ